MAETDNKTITITIPDGYVVCPDCSCIYVDSPICQNPNCPYCNGSDEYFLTIPYSNVSGALLYATPNALSTT